MTLRHVVTGIKPTGTPHLGNLAGAILPSLALSQDASRQSFYFIADLHALTSLPDPRVLRQHTYDVAATWLAMGLDPQKTIFYRQSRVEEVLELYWFLACLAPKGLLNRSHAYKAAVAESLGKGEEGDSGVLMGLFNYPILMAADILLYKGQEVPVGRDQLQHLEIARDLATKFNLTYGADILVLPEASHQKDTPPLPGLDGRKMSKSYHNTIPLFCSSDVLRSLIFKIKTNSLPPQAPKDSQTCTLFQIFRLFASAQEVETMGKRYESGIGWGEMKEVVFQLLENHLGSRRATYLQLMENPTQLEDILQEGEEKARTLARQVIQEVRSQIGLGRRTPLTLSCIWHP